MVLKGCGGEGTALRDEVGQEESSGCERPSIIPITAMFSQVDTNSTH